MGAQGKAFTFVQRDQGEELTKVENLINMVVPQATIEGFEARPQPDDWTDAKPSDFVSQSAPKPVPSRFEQVYGARSGAAASTTAQPLPPRNIGSKIPITRRHKRRR
jgi:hypothetical protein